MRSEAKSALGGKKENFERSQVIADSILNPKFRGKLNEFISSSHDCETLIETALNLIGLESKRVGFSKKEKQTTLKKIISKLKEIEQKEEPAKIFTKGTIEKFIKELKRVGLGKSMVAKIAENVEKKLEEKNLMESFVMALKYEIENNVYYKMVENGMSKFGNDSATGLRFVRHFDFVQVSSNPVIAAKAYEEFPNLWDDFKEIVKVNPEWQRNPEKYADEITVYATITSLLPNLFIFRPLALLSDFRDGLVSYQLNPFLAENVKASVKDAEKICAILRNILYKYDVWLGWNADKYKGRPNIVFKVAASSPAAIGITYILNSKGIGTNNTVTYSVSQELTLLFAEILGMAEALKNGMPITQVYQTNMIGRLADHLRDINKDCSEELKEAIKYSGVYITRKVYNLFFHPKNAKKWMASIKKEYNLSNAQIKEIFNKIDLLPASKRHVDDTYCVLGSSNVTNTEFPTHQQKVFEASLEKEFDLEKYRNSIKTEPDPVILKKLLEIPDFRRAYEEYGMKPEEWQTFGPVIKTMTEFKDAYLDFQKKVLEFVKSIKEE